MDDLGVATTSTPAAIAAQWLESCQDFLSNTPSSFMATLRSATGGISSTTSSTTTPNHFYRGEHLSSLLIQPKFFLSLSTLLLSFSGFKWLLGMVASRAIMRRQHQVDILLRNATNNTTSCHYSLHELLNLCIGIYLHEYLDRAGQIPTRSSSLSSMSSSSMLISRLLSFVPGRNRHLKQQVNHSNQLPCCLIAIHHLMSKHSLSVADGNEDGQIVLLMKRFFINYEPRLRICLGDDYKELMMTSSQNVIYEENVDLRVLFSGLSGADFQPFIQYAYGIISGNVSTQRDALQYMQLTYQSLENNTGTHIVLLSQQIQQHQQQQQQYQAQAMKRDLNHSEVELVKKMSLFRSQYAQAINDFDIIELLNGIKHIFGGRSFVVGRCKHAQLSKKLYYLSTDSPVAPLFQALRIVSLSDKLHVEYLLEKLTICTLLMLIENGVYDYETTQLVCLVHAARIVIESHSGPSFENQESEDFRWSILRQTWFAVLGFFLFNGMSPQIPTTLDLETKGVKRVEDILEWEDIIKLLRNSITGSSYSESSRTKRDPYQGLEHSIKLIFSCEEQSRAYPQYQFLFRYIASERIKMHE